MLVRHSRNKLSDTTRKLVNTNNSFNDLMERFFK